MYPPTLWQHTQCQYFAEPTSQNNLYSFQFLQIYSLQFINLNSIWPAVKIEKFCSLPFNEKGSKASLKWAMVLKVFPLAMQNTWQNHTQTGMPPAPDLQWNSQTKDNTANVFYKNS